MNAHKDYTDLVKRSAPLIMLHGEQVAFLKTLDRLRAKLRFFGESV